MKKKKAKKIKDMKSIDRKGNKKRNGKRGGHGFNSTWKKIR
jgi:hypothetical protein